MIIAGVDEVGRGCLAGPVYAGASILKNTTDFNSEDFLEINDSSLLKIRIIK